MAKTYLGIDIGHDILKLALVKDGIVKKTASVSMPVNLLREGRITSVDTLGGLLQQTMKEAHIRANRAAAILAGDYAYLRSTFMPMMNAEQLAYNIPYEFSDYITGELKNYIFDYAVIPDLPADDTAAGNGAAEEEDGNKLHLLVAAAPAEAIEELRIAFRKAGMKLEKAVPPECAYISLLRDYERRTGQKDQEYCILDLGFRAIRMYMFHGPRHVTTRALDIGLSSLNSIIAEAKNVDEHLAHTYLISNFEDCQTQDFCLAAYDNISVELMRALNFYRFSNPNSQITCAYLSGGGAEILALRDSIAQTLGIEIRTVDELMKPENKLADGFTYAQAIGCTLD